MEGRQFSTSRGVVIYVGDFLSRYDPDPLRYFLTAAGPETQDTDFTWAEFVRRNNDELVANWGNLVNRTLTSAYKNFGAVPEPGELQEADRAVIREVEGGFDTVGELIERAKFRAALAETMRLASVVNQYVSEQAPWAAMEDDRDRAGTVLYAVLRSIDNLKLLLHTVPAFQLPDAARAARLRRRHCRTAAVRGDRGGRRPAARRPHRRLSDVVGRLGADGAPRGAGAARAAAAVHEARSRAGRRGRAGADAARRSSVIA